MATDTKGKSLQVKHSIISKKVKDYGNDPFFIKKANASQAFLEKNGFPKEIVSKK